jgi:hypothetical protein
VSGKKALADLQQVIDFIASHPSPSRKVGETTYGVFRNEKESQEQHRRIRGALQMVGLPTVDDGPREIWPASKLTADQRAVVELLARHPEVPAGDLPMPTAAWAKRKWLGIDPPGPLFSGEPSLLQKLMLIEPDDDDAWMPLLKRLSKEDRIIVLTELTLLRGDFDTVATHNALLDEVSTLPTKLRAWAERTADMLLGFVGTPFETQEAWPWGIEALVAEVVLRAMVCGNGHLDAKFERLLSLENYAYEGAVARMREIIDAIPADRREGAVAAAVERLKGPVHRLAIAMRMLDAYPYASLVRLAIANIEEGKPRKVMQQLTALGKKHPAIAETLRAVKAGLPPTPKLVVLERSEPTSDELDTIAKRQVETCAKLFDGRKVSAEKLLAGDEDEPIAPFERTRIADGASKPAFDAWRYSGDAGTIFRAGTTDVVAEIIQDGLECSDAGLRMALVDALASKPTKAKAKPIPVAKTKPAITPKPKSTPLARTNPPGKRSVSTASSVLAIISKAIFEKEAPKSVKVGDLIATDHYTSKHKTLELLAEGGSLFLVTVRPPNEELWLVAILETPTFKRDAWVAAANKVPIANITSAIKKLEFSTGQGIAAKPGALGMSLQTPRVLTDADEKLLRALAAKRR